MLGRRSVPARIAGTGRETDAAVRCGRLARGRCAESGGRPASAGRGPSSARPGSYPPVPGTRQWVGARRRGRGTGEGGEVLRRGARLADPAPGKRRPGPAGAVGGPDGQRPGGGEAAAGRDRGKVHAPARDPPVPAAPALRLPVDVLRGARRFPLVLEWLLPAGMFAPVCCPACGADAASWSLVAAKTHVGCARSLSKVVAGPPAPQSPAVPAPRPAVHTHADGQGKGSADSAKREVTDSGQGWG